MIAYRAKMSAWVPLAAADPLAGSGLGTAAITLNALSLAATGTVANQVFPATLAATLGPLSLSATGAAQATGTAAVTLGSLGLVAFGTVADAGVVTGTLHATLDPLTLAATGSVSAHPAVGTLNATLGGLVLAGRGTVANQVFRGTLAATLGTLSLAGAGTVATLPRVGALHATLGPVTLAARGHVVIVPTSWPHEWCPMPGPTRTNTLKVETVVLGDGYTYRLTRGLNPVGSTLTYAFPFEDVDHLTEMDAFLKQHGARGFAFTPPEADDPIFVCCNAWSATLTDRTGTSGEMVGQLTSTFERRFNLQPGNPA